MTEALSVEDGAKQLERHYRLSGAAARRRPRWRYSLLDGTAIGSIVGCDGLNGRLHLVDRRTLATMISKYLEGNDRSQRKVKDRPMIMTFSARLNRLFDTVYPPGRGPHTSAEVIAALRAEGVTMSAPYLSQLRSGNRTNPSVATMAALANFFRIKPAYFTDDEYYEKLDNELTWLASMRDEGIRRIAARTVGLSPEAQQDLVLKADELRRQENLDD